MPFIWTAFSKVLRNWVFENAVDAADLLFLAELETVADDFGFAVFTVLAGNEVALFDGTLFSVAALTLEE